MSIAFSLSSEEAELREHSFLHLSLSLSLALDSDSIHRQSQFPSPLKSPELDFTPALKILDKKKMVIFFSLELLFFSPDSMFFLFIQFSLSSVVVVLNLIYSDYVMFHWALHEFFLFGSIYGGMLNVNEM